MTTQPRKICPGRYTMLTNWGFRWSCNCPPSGNCQPQIFPMNHCHHRPASLWNCKSIKSRGRTLRLLPFGYARLPKLEVRKFGGNIGEWEEFWESFESAINKNSTLTDVDKYSYLRGLLVELARSAIAGFALMSANYKAATELLKRRYGKKTTIQRTYINDLMNIEPIYSERDAHWLRALYDFAETNYRVLEALGVDEETYSTIVVPLLLEKLPEQLRLMVIRDKDHHKWKLEKLSDILGHEVELREEYQRNTRHTRNPWDDLRRKTSMYTGKQTNCAFCLRGYNHEECKKVMNVHERKQSLVKFGRCFNCIWKGHLSRAFKTNVICNCCKGKHHLCLCSADFLRDGGASGNLGNPSSGDSVGNSMHVRTGNCVALQTAQSQIVGKENAQIKVLFDTASHMSFVSSRVAKGFSIETLWKEWLALNTFWAAGGRFKP